MYLLRKLQVTIGALLLLYTVITILIVTTTLEKLDRLYDKNRILSSMELALKYNSEMHTREAALDAEYKTLHDNYKYMTMMSVFEQKIRFHLVCKLALLTAATALLLFLLTTIFLSNSVSPIEKILNSISVYVKSGKIMPVPENKKSGFYELACEYNTLLRDIDRKIRYEKAEAALTTTKLTGKMLIHEIKNKLSPIQLITAGLKKTTGELYKKDFEVMERNCDAVNNIIKTFRDLVNLPDVELESVALYDELIQIGESYAALGNTNIDDSVKGVSVFTDKKLINIICTNLIKNALEAPRPAGVNGNLVNIHFNKSENALVFTDNGTGVNEEIAGKIFNPGFTTKQSGDGMGLFIVKNLANILRCDVVYKDGAFRLIFDADTSKNAEVC